MADGLRLLLFSDLHADAEAARRLVTLSRSADVLVGAGDFANARRDIGVCIDVLREVALPAVLVPGNNESAEELAEACLRWPSARVLHGRGCQVGSVHFFGLAGGVPPTPFGPWSYDLTEEQAAEKLAACPDGCVLVSHSPPRGVVDRSSSGKNLGSEAVREAVLRCRPALVVCGHVHGSGGRWETLGDTPVVNAGPAGVPWRLGAGPAGRG